MNLLLRNLPEKTHKKVVAAAKRNGRSVNQEALELFERAVELAEPLRLPPPIKFKRPVTSQEIRALIRKGRP